VVGIFGLEVLRGKEAKTREKYKGGKEKGGGVLFVKVVWSFKAPS